MNKEKINTAETETKIELKPIGKLVGESFFIPDYQRGYRWEEQQVNDLLNDLDEFKESIAQIDDKKIYCLQPLVVKKENEELQGKCNHEFDEHGFCIYCYRSKY